MFADLFTEDYSYGCNEQLLEYKPTLVDCWQEGKQTTLRMLSFVLSFDFVNIFTEKQNIYEKIVQLLSFKNMCEDGCVELDILSYAIRFVASNSMPEECWPGFDSELRWTITRRHKFNGTFADIWFVGSTERKSHILSNVKQWYAGSWPVACINV